MNDFEKTSNASRKNDEQIIDKIGIFYNIIITDFIKREDYDFIFIRSEKNENSD